MLFTFAKLPSGVNVFPGAEVDGKERPNEISEKEESFVPDVQKTTLVLLADADAPVTRMPRWLSLEARPIVGGAGRLTPARGGDPPDGRQTDLLRSQQSRYGA